jgi:acetolactate synthase-1/2/3 large subunit
MKVSDYISEFLAEQGVTHVFEVVGGMITHIVDSVSRSGKVKLVSMHHEQAAAFAADAYGRLTGVPGVAMATSGPGATNLLTGIGSCYFDSTPAVFITGQVNRHEQKGDRPLRQLGFQETDIVAMAKPITKACWKAAGPEEVPQLLEAAFATALSGRPGPVLLDIPMDVQRMDIPQPVPGRVLPVAGESVKPADVRDVLQALAEARRPLILAGGGIRSSRTADLFARFVERLGVPVVASLMAVDVLPYTHPLRVGFLGSYGNRWANLAIGRSDFLLVLGSRLDVRQTGADTKGFKGERTIYHVDCDAAEVNNRVSDCKPILAELKSFFEASLAQDPASWLDRENWIDEINGLRKQWPDRAELAGISGINPNEFMHELSVASRDAQAFVVDVGQHQMWAAQSLEIGAGQRFFTSGGMGSMGFALPAAIGAAMADPGRPVVVIAGDGGFQLNLQELQTIVRNNIPIKIVVLNNECHGMVRQFQESYFESRYASTYWGYSAPDFSNVARAYGLNSATVSAPEQVSPALREMWGDPARPFLLQVMIDMHANAYPKIAFGHPITEMEPFVKPVEMEGT